MSTAGSFTQQYRSDWGNFSVMIGTLAMNDYPTVAVDTGMKQVYAALNNSNGNVYRLTAVVGGGTILPNSAATNASMVVLVIGV